MIYVVNLQNNKVFEFNYLKQLFKNQGINVSINKLKELGYKIIKRRYYDKQTITSNKLSIIWELTRRHINS